MRSWRWWSLAVVLVAGACAEPPFSVHVRDNSVADIQRTLTQTGGGSSGPRSGAHPMAYLVTAGEKHLVGYDLEAGKVVWDVVADVTSRVTVGRGFVAHRQGTTDIAVRAADTGQVRCTVKLNPGEKLLGLAADERLYYTVEASGAAKVKQSWLVSVDSSCLGPWRDEAGGSLGAPAARHGVVAVPYHHQNVVFLDGKSGAELARVRSTEEEVSYVRAAPEGFFYGSNTGFYLFTSESATGTRKGSAHTVIRLGSEHLRTFYYWDGYQPAQVDYTAFDRNRLLWRAAPTDGGGVKLRDSLAYLHSYRFLFGFDATSGAVRWAYMHPRFDVIGSDHAGPTLVFVASDGELGALDSRTGALLWSKKTNLKVAGATFDADGFAPKGEGGVPPLTKTLAAVVWDPDARFTAVKVYAVEALAKAPGDEVTDELLKIVQKEALAPQVAKVAADVLIARKDKAAAPKYRTALGVRYDYLTDQRPRALEVLARMVAAIDDKEAVPLLGVQLLDPSTPPAALKEIVKALVGLGTKDALAPLRNLLLTYRCDPTFSHDPAALVMAGDGLLKLGGEAERRTVAFVAEEPRTLESLSSKLKKSLAPPPPPAATTTPATAPAIAPEAGKTEKP